MVGVQEVADIQEGVVLGRRIVALEVIPAELDELLAVHHQQLGGLLDEERGQA